MHKSSTLKILYIPSWYPDKKNPKHGIYFKEQANQLNDDVSLYIFNVKRIFYKNFISEITNAFLNDTDTSTYDFRYYDFVFKNADRRIKLYENAVLKNFKNIIGDTGIIDLIHAQVTYPAGYGAYTISKKYNIPFIVTEHSSNFERNYKLLNTCYKIVLENASYYTAISNFVKDKIIKYRSQCDVIPNFIDFKKFTNVSKCNNWAYSDKFNLINISDIEKLKGIDVLLEALNILINKYNKKQMFLHLIGAGEQLKEYRHLSYKLGVNKYCKFYGLVEYSKIPEIISECSVLVIASRMETFGIVGIEAMALGLPVVSTDCGGTRDYINNDNGILVKKESPLDLANGIMEIYNNYSEYDKNRIKEYCYNNYSGEIVTKKIIALYKKILGSCN